MIEQLELTNFKAFQHAEIAFRPLTLLTGLNSTGKSSVLQALALLHQSYTAGQLDHATDLADGRPELAAAEGFLLNGELVELGTGQDVLTEDFLGEAQVTLAIVDAHLRYSWTVAYHQDQDLLPLTAVELPGTTEGADAPSGDAASIPEYFRAGFQYLRADRIVPAVGYPRSHQVAIKRGFLGIHGEHAVNYLRHHADYSVPKGLRHRNASGHRLVEQVDAWMQELCPGVNVRAIAIEGTDTVNLSYAFGGTSGVNSTLRRRPTNVGFGLTHALPIVVACLTARPGSLVLLENPEAHLHPKGQTQMALLAAAAGAHGAQLVVETHSDHVLNGVRLAVKNQIIDSTDVALHYFRGGESGLGVEVISPNVGADGLLDQWPEGFFDEWENALDQLI
ncbi:DUF3696 domain-containing protein [Embleya sp. NPDC008237]|uniref:AAA family ATPase n=1 Tax=Embleya sp. NPDC008237 TaxID=3363978 RepID=UPI0036EAD95D